MTNETAKQPVYPPVEAHPSFPEIEQRILAYWKAENVFQASLDAREKGENGKNEFVFYDGPPFANGLPHYGHLLTGFAKDLIPRYQTMRGLHVDRRFGWDCHGLPAELEAERQLGISGRRKILAYGVERFNEHCRESALRYTKQWEEIVTRQARWVDFKRDYKTMDLSYMESVIWAFKRLWELGLVYEGLRVQPYSWAAETPVSNFETRLDNSYREREDPAVTVMFTLLPEQGDPGPINLLAWTTTPWTLPSNMALAVGPDLEYSIFEEDGVRYVVNSETAVKYKQQLKKATRAGTIPGKDLVGRRYTPLFPYFKDKPNAFRVIAADFVDVGEGTGVVHIAPGFGEDDLRVGEENGLPVVCPVDEHGRFTDEVSDYAGVQVFDANDAIVKALKEARVLVKFERYRHNYPHCWRTDTPLIYKAISSWFVEVEKFRDRMVAHNASINWIPEHIRDGLFGNWLKGAQNWSISRNRFWGAPIPIWRSDDPTYPRIDVYGSLDEIERDFGQRPASLHRPAIDALTRPNPDDPTGKSTMRRVDEVLDCWFESGSMPFAQVHYPFENREWFESHFPADFITEYVAQTRGWFYTLIVLSTALFDRPPFRNAICHGVVLDEDGHKLSKRLKNYPSPEEVFAKHGADALRWFLISSPIFRGQNLMIDRHGEDIAKAARQVLIPMWNTYYFFTLYANADGVRAEFRTDSEHLLDRYIFAKTRQLTEQVTGFLERYDISGACWAITEYIDALSNWYVRRSRERFWAHEHTQDKANAYNTLYSVLTTLLRLLAPFLPLVGEEMYRNITGQRSVHLADWPRPDELPRNDELLSDMDRVREICSVASSIRKSHNLRKRQPLARLTLVGAHLDGLDRYTSMIQDEINVKEIEFSKNVESVGHQVLKINSAVLGPRLGPAFKNVLAASKSGQWTRTGDGGVEVAGQKLEEGEYSMNVVAKDGMAAAETQDRSAIVVLDVTLTPELELEGTARDLVRLIQNSRREMDLLVTDRIELSLNVPGEMRQAVEAHRDYIAEQTLANRISLDDGAAAQFTQEEKLAGGKVVIGLTKASG